VSVPFRFRFVTPKVLSADRSETKIYDLVLFRNHSENSMTHISVVTYGALSRAYSHV
jgi:hypothetical protein